MRIHLRPKIINKINSIQLKGIDFLEFHPEHVKQKLKYHTALSHSLCIFDQQLFSKTEEKNDLYEQVKFSNMNTLVATFIIDHLSEYGFFQEDIVESSKLLHASTKDFYDTLHSIHKLEPNGIGVANGLDFLRYQIQDELDLRYQILTYETELLDKQFEVVAKKLNRETTEVIEAFSSLQQLRPFPIFLGTTTTEYNNCVVKINNDLSLDYLEHFSDFDYDETIEYFLESRKNTIISITNYIIEKQKSYLLENKELLYLTQTEIAIALHLSTSTVSRAIKNKSIQYKNNELPFSFFFLFDNKKQRIINIIKETISNDPSISDQKIVSKIKEKDMIISRRTINKYRTLYCKD